MEKYLIYLIHKIGGAGLMLPYEQLLAWVRYILNDIKPGSRIIIVVSALAKVTTKLQDIFENKSNGDTAKAWEVFKEIKELHLQRCTDLFVEETDNLFDYFHEIEYFISHGSINEENPTISKAQLLKFGELMSSEIFNQFLLKEHVAVKLIDAQNMVFATGEDYCYSEPLQPKTSEMISQIIESEITNDDTVILTQGYICNQRLLGFDGSDLTISLIASSLKLANPNCYVKTTFWKDVEGVMVNGIVQSEISIDLYNSLDEVPVRKDAINTNSCQRILTIIRSFLNLKHPGTLIVWE